MDLRNTDDNFNAAKQYKLAYGQYRRRVKLAGQMFECARSLSSPIETIKEGIKLDDACVLEIGNLLESLLPQSRQAVQIAIAGRAFGADPLTLRSRMSQAQLKGCLLKKFQSKPRTAPS